MSLTVLLAVLVGALLHAVWNVAVRAGQDRRREMMLVVAGATVIAVVVLPWLRQPLPASWPHLAISGVLHVVYFALVGEAYARGGVALAYPLMRGAAPLLASFAAWLVLGERLAPGAWLGVGAICGGVVLLARRTNGADERTSTLLALGNAVVIASYTLNDAMGARASGAPVAYTLWVLPLCAGPTLWWLTRRAGARAWPARAEMARGLGGGACTLGAYALGLWAMTHADVAPVAALRETAMLFGIILARVTLGERPGARGWAAVGAIAVGAAVLRLA